MFGQFTRPGKQFGQIRQDRYPRAAGGPVIYAPPRQPGGPVPIFGWFRASRHLPCTLAKLAGTTLWLRHRKPSTVQHGG